MVRDHRFAEGRIEGGGLGRWTALGPGAVARRLGREPRLVKQLIAFQHPFLVPRRAILGEQQAQARQLGLIALGPGLQGRNNGLVDQARAAPPPVLPGEEARPGRPGGVGHGGFDGVGRQGQIAHRDDPRGAGAHVGQGRIAALVAEGVELLDIAELEACLGGDEGAQGQLEGALALRIERAEGQAAQG